MPLFNKLSLRSKLSFMMALIVIIATSIIIIFDSNKFYSHTIEIVDNNINISTENLVARSDTWLKSNEEITAVIAEALTIINPDDKASISKELYDISKHVNVLNMHVGTLDGVLTSALPITLPDDYDPRVRGWYVDAVKKDGVITTDPYIDVASGMPMIGMSAPVKYNGELVGVLLVDISMEQLRNMLLSSDDSGLNGTSILKTKDGSIVVHPNDEFTMKNIADVLAEGDNIMNHFSSNTDTTPYEYIDENGEEKLIISKYLTTVNWNLLYEISLDDIYSSLRLNTLYSIIISLLMLVASIVSIIIIIKILFKDIYSLRSLMEENAKGEADLTKRLPVKSNDDLGIIAKSMNIYTEQLQRTVIDINKTVESTLSESSQISNILGTLNDSLQHQSNELKTVTNDTEAVSNTFLHISELTDNNKYVLEKATESANSGNISLNEVAESIETIDVKTNELSATITNLTDASSKI